MAQVPAPKASLSHQERTATEPRDDALHPVVIDEILDVNNRIRRFRLCVKNRRTISFLPGQWLDVHIPGVDKVGGFSITSTPQRAVSSTTDDYLPYVELAVQKSPDNPPAVWLWRPVEEIKGKELYVRVGGSFVWPPHGVDMTTVRRAVFIAGGVGITPVMSMVSHIHEQDIPMETRVLYSTKAPSIVTQPSEVLFYPELLDLFRKPRSRPNNNRLEIFLTGTWDGTEVNRKDDEPVHPLMSLTLPELFLDAEVPVLAWTHRIDSTAISTAAGSHLEAPSSVFFVCGPPEMTDHIVKELKRKDHVEPERVFCEKWW